MHTATGSAPVEYVGFWERVLAAVVDSVLVSLLISPLGIYLFGIHPINLENFTANDFLLASIHPNNLFTHVLAGLAIVLFWVFRSADPGKMLIRAVIVDARTFGKPGTGQLIGRYLGYFISTVPFGLGLLWVGWDARKQGWHDKLAGTLVIRAVK